MEMHNPIHAPATVSFALVEDLLLALEVRCGAEGLQKILKRAEFSARDNHTKTRLSRDQIVRLYQVAAQQSGDEMMGLWSRPIRPGALKQICTTILGASSIGAGIYRMATFWNLVLDDYFLEISNANQCVVVQLKPRGRGDVNRFGHMLMLKLAHGLASWLAGRELPVAQVDFAFAKPPFAADYPVLFPCEARFDQPFTAISFDRALWSLPIQRTASDLQRFLTHAPRDWIFTESNEHALTLKLREMVYTARFDLTLNDAAAALHVTPRTLIRRLNAQGSSFQAIKDSLRRDMAIAGLTEGQPIEALAQTLGFASAATFHRAFKHWTGDTPAAYRDRI
ncbi:Helix-turn-helix domain-containing protein [Cognatishimia maritima]|uniref:Helix-turn-helix domain-containing protein n=1 Tax=Cognatishimia maritima TaxID=870908 RepID=A0A1M5TT15_9RHOB|nr:Helix-turn-helix domain-containing protein [Cognatishimia maritima]